MVAINVYINMFHNIIYKFQYIPLIKLYEYINYWCKIYFGVSIMLLFSEASVLTTWYMKVHWVSFNTVNAASITVTLLYYVLLEVSKYFQNRVSPPIGA